MNREDAKDAKEEERRMRQLGEQVEQLAYRAIGAAIEVHRLLGPGFLALTVEAPRSTASVSDGMNTSEATIARLTKPTGTARV